MWCRILAFVAFLFHWVKGSVPIALFELKEDLQTKAEAHLGWSQY
jgi:hypothetical protein